MRRFILVGLLLLATLIEALDQSPGILRDDKGDVVFTTKCAQTPTISLFSTKPPRTIDQEYTAFVSRLLKEQLPHFEWLGYTNPFTLPFHIRYVQVKDGKEPRHHALYKMVESSDQLYLAPTLLEYRKPEETNNFLMEEEDPTFQVHSDVFPVANTSTTSIDIRKFATAFSAYFTMRLLPTVQRVRSMGEIVEAVKARLEMVKDQSVAFAPTIVVVAYVDLSEKNKEDAAYKVASLSALSASAAESVLCFVSSSPLPDGWPNKPNQICYRRFDEMTGTASKEDTKGVVCVENIMEVVRDTSKDHFSLLGGTHKMHQIQRRPLTYRPLRQLRTTEQLHFELTKYQRRLVFIAFLSQKDPFFHQHRQVLSDFRLRRDKRDPSSLVGMTPVEVFWVDADAFPRLAEQLGATKIPSLFVGMRLLTDTVYYSSDPVYAFHQINHFDLNATAGVADRKPESKEDLQPEFPTVVKQLLNMLTYRNLESTLGFQPVRRRALALEISSGAVEPEEEPKNEYVQAGHRYFPQQAESFPSAEALVGAAAGQPKYMPKNMDKIKEEMERRKAQKKARMMNKTMESVEQHKNETTTMAEEAKKEAAQDAKSKVRRVTDVSQYPKRSAMEDEKLWAAEIKKSTPLYFGFEEETLFFRNSLEYPKQP
ncbi:hypothetical protein ADEAN_000929600 [Angomonas deanei]|uniref:Uncharacterized protein n=1 Tax=Angomonas deanei TaxID=59799 RepID=A0A7G2CRY3_9TRYP|nr:hypothetical protein ADEAN_000929600 [Angomonas deanei]